MSEKITEKEGNQRIKDLSIDLSKFLQTNQEKSPLIIIFSFLTIIIHLSKMRKFPQDRLRALIFGYLEKYERDIKKEKKKIKINQQQLDNLMDEFFDKNKKFTSQQFDEKLDYIVDTYDIIELKKELLSK